MINKFEMKIQENFGMIKICKKLFFCTSVFLGTFVYGGNQIFAEATSEPPVQTETAETEIAKADIGDVTLSNPSSNSSLASFTPERINDSNPNSLIRLTYKYVNKYTNEVLESSSEAYPINLKNTVIDIAYKEKEISGYRYIGNEAEINQINDGDVTGEVIYYYQKEATTIVQEKWTLNTAIRIRDYHDLYPELHLYTLDNSYMGYRDDVFYSETALPQIIWTKDQVATWSASAGYIVSYETFKTQILTPDLTDQRVSSDGIHFEAQVAPSIKKEIADNYILNNYQLPESTYLTTGKIGSSNTNHGSFTTDDAGNVSFNSWDEDRYYLCPIYYRVNINYVDEVTGNIINHTNVSNRDGSDNPLFRKDLSDPQKIIDNYDLGNYLSLYEQEYEIVSYGTLSNWKETKNYYDTEITYDFNVNVRKNSPENTKTSTVNVSYVDEEGNKVSDSETLEGNIGETYNIVQKDIPGYTFKEVSGATSGIFTEKSIDVKYIYTKTASSDGKTGNNIDKSKDNASQLNNQKNLPETGMKNDNLFFIIGLTCITIAGASLLLKKEEI